ncbi:MAG: dockerin type I domain-containing protein [Sedimentisphaerales bacterium]
MGAYGGTSQASKNGNIADLNVDGRVDFLDLAQLGNL